MPASFQQLHSKRRDNVLNGLYAQLESLTKTELADVFNVEADEYGRITDNGFSTAKSILKFKVDKIITIIWNYVKDACVEEIYQTVQSIAVTLLPDAQVELSDNLWNDFSNSRIFEKTMIGWKSWLTIEAIETLKFTSAPGRRVSSSIASLRRSLLDLSYPNSVILLASSLLKLFYEQCYRDAVVSSLLTIGRSRVALSCNHDDDLCRALQGVFDVRFLPQVPSVECTCELHLVDEPMDYPNKIYVDGEPVIIPKLEEILSKEEILHKVRKVGIVATYADLIERELEFMGETYSAFATDEYRAGKDYGKTVTGRNTVSFGDEIEVLAQYIYGGTVTSVKTPVDVITPKFCIEAKAASAMEVTEDERGHIATHEVVRKYLFADKLRTLGYTGANHKYVLGVFDLENDLVRIYEQNYYSNKNSVTMTPVAVLYNYSQIQWDYSSTPYKEFKVTGIRENGVLPENIDIFRTQEELNDPFYWEVVRAHRTNIRDGNIVLSFDNEVVKRGIIYDSNVAPEDRARIAFAWTQYHNKFSRRAAYCGKITFSDLKALLESEDQRLTDPILEAEWELPGIVIEFEDLYYLPGFRIRFDPSIGVDTYLADIVPITFMKSVFLNENEYTQLAPVFKQAGLDLLPIESGRRLVRMKEDGRIEYDVKRPVLPAFKDNVVVKWEDGTVETMNYDEFNQNHRLLKQGVFETLSERGLEIPPDIDDGTELTVLSVNEKRERIQAAKVVLNKEVVLE